MKNLNLLYKNIFWAIVTLAVLSLVFSVLINPAPTSSFSIDQLVEKINKGEVAKIAVNGNELLIDLKNGDRASARKESELGLTETLRNYGVDSPALQQTTFEVREESGIRFWLSILIPTVLPILVILGIFWFIFRQAKTGASQAFTFGRANIRLFAPHKEKISFKDVAGLKEAK